MVKMLKRIYEKYICLILDGFKSGLSLIFFSGLFSQLLNNKFDGKSAITVQVEMYITNSVITTNHVSAG